MKGDGNRAQTSPNEKKRARGEPSVRLHKTALAGTQPSHESDRNACLTNGCINHSMYPLNVAVRKENYTIDQKKVNYRLYGEYQMSSLIRFGKRSGDSESARGTGGKGILFLVVVLPLPAAGSDDSTTHWNGRLCWVAARPPERDVVRCHPTCDGFFSQSSRTRPVGEACINTEAVFFLGLNAIGQDLSRLRKSRACAV